MNQIGVYSGTRKLALGATVLLLFLLLIPSVAFGVSTYTVKVDKNYLALRTAPAYDSSNEIGKLYTGDVVTLVDDSSNASYWKVNSPKYNKTGWVNKDYLIYEGDSDDDYRVTVKKNYLALRTMPAYDSDNEIGKLYTGDVVRVESIGKGQYWWVYSYKYDREGYVNSDYLTSITSDYGNRTVKVDKNYLALRDAPSYDSGNEIGKLYTGDVVRVEDMSNGQYWWVYSYKYDREGYVNKDYLQDN